MEEKLSWDAAIEMAVAQGGFEGLNDDEQEQITEMLKECGKSQEDFEAAVLAMMEDKGDVDLEDIGEDEIED